MNKEESILGVTLVFLLVFTAGIWILMGTESVFSESRSLNAMLKGSIYETGEYMSVFGTCSDSNDIPIENATALFSAWYPNGTNYLINQSMTEISTGYFVWQGAMTVVEGTYLTRLECIAFNQSAFAFGEWQNPVWVNRIAEIQNDTNTTLSLLYGLNGTLVSINASINTNLNTTYSYLENLTNLTSSGFNSTYQNITYVIQNTTGNAANTNSLINQSFNTNSTYLAQLLLQLINITTYDPTISVTWREEYNQPVYWKNWKLKVYVYDANNRSVGHPNVDCSVQMYQDGRTDPLVNMAWRSGGIGDDGSDQADSEGYFYATIFINGREINWTTTCYGI